MITVVACVRSLLWCSQRNSNSAGVPEFLLDTEVASRLMRGEQRAVTSLRRSSGRSAGAFDVMIAAHAEALGMTLATSDAAIKT
jgi:predicted nucleic acid-binding protein